MDTREFAMAGFVAQSKLEFSLPIFDQPKKEPTANPSSMV